MATIGKAHKSLNGELSIASLTFVRSSREFFAFYDSETVGDGVIERRRISADMSDSHEEASWFVQQGTNDWILSQWIL